MKNTKKFFLIFSLLLILILFLLVFLSFKNKGVENLSNNQQQNTTLFKKTSFTEREDFIKDILAKKYLIDSKNAEVLIAREAPGFINGIFLSSDLDSSQGNIYFYAIFDKKIEVIWSGASDPDCSILEKYNFPPEMAETCYK